MRHVMNRRLPLVILAAMALSCAGSPSTPNGGDRPRGGDPPARGDAGDPRPAAVLRDGFQYQADVLVMESFPVQLVGRVTITNATERTRTVSFPDGCVALLRAYRTGGGEPVWDQASEVGCTEAIVPVTLAPGGSREVSTPTASAGDILDEGLPDGRYRVTVYLRPASGEVEIEAGAAELAIPR